MEEELRVEKELDMPTLAEDEGKDALEFVNSVTSSSKSINKLEAGWCNGEEEVEVGAECIGWKLKPSSGAAAAAAFVDR